MASLRSLLRQSTVLPTMVLLQHIGPSRYMSPSRVEQIAGSHHTSLDRSHWYHQDPLIGKTWNIPRFRPTQAQTMNQDAATANTSLQRSPQAPMPHVLLKVRISCSEIAFLPLAISGSSKEIHTSSTKKPRVPSGRITTTTRAKRSPGRTNHGEVRESSDSSLRFRAEGADKWGETCVSENSS